MAPPPKKEKPKVEQKVNEEKAKAKAAKKEAAKAKKAAHKAKEQEAKGGAAGDAQQAKKEEMSEDNAKGKYGDYGIINSAVVVEREYTPVGQLDLSKSNKSVWIRARLQNSRPKVRFL